MKSELNLTELKRNWTELNGFWTEFNWTKRRTEMNRFLIELIFNNNWIELMTLNGTKSTGNELKLMTLNWTATVVMNFRAEMNLIWLKRAEKGLEINLNWT